MIPKHLRDTLDAGLLRDSEGRPRVIQCSTCDNHEELGGEITAQTLIDDNWLLEPVVYCPKCGEDEE